jgi:hypothetical protein
LHGSSQKVSADAATSSKCGAPHEDIQNARRIIGQGQGWIDRLEQALKNGAVLPNGGKYSKG